MAHRRTTMQDIADACGLSRNTVSKIFNGRGAVPEATRRTVMQTARAMGYHLEFGGEPEAARQMRNIALITRKIPVDAHFGTFFLPVFTGCLSRAGYTLTIHEASPEELRRRILPASLSLEQAAGLLVIELFDPAYLEMLCGLGLPCLSVDAGADAEMRPMNCDIISMENLSSAYELTAHVIAAGASRPGFVGDFKHCSSFHQRWTGFCRALENAGLALDKRLCILERDSPLYSDEEWLFTQLQNMPVKPDALICANDFLALRIMTALKWMGLGVPGDVMVAGFDGTPQSAVVEPSLTTAQIPSSDIGCIAADMLLDRIENPGRAFRCTYVKTAPVWRKSTAR